MNFAFAHQPAVRNLICGGGGGLPTGRSGGFVAEKLGRFTIPAWDMVQSTSQSLQTV